MDFLSDVLSQLKLTGTLYFRTSFTSPWSIAVPPFKRVSRFHFAHKGRCFVRVKKEQEPVLLEQGDLLIITRGASHTLYCDPTTEHEAVQLDKVVEESGFSGHGTLVYGSNNLQHDTQLICGHFAFDEDATHPLIDQLPTYIHIQDYGHTAGKWMESTLNAIGAEAGKDALGSDLIALKMSEIIYAQAIRTYLGSSPAPENQLAGFSDRILTRVLTAIHRAPHHSWNLDELSSIAGLSRTSLSNRFTQLLSVTPLGYITQWRMQLARQRLVSSMDSLIDIAEDVGYQSEAAFSRVFKKHFDISPATYRRLKRTVE